MKTLVVIFLAAWAAYAQQPGIRSGTASPGTVNLGSNPITESWTVGTGGVTANKLVQTDSSAPLKIIDATTGVYGVAMATVAAAGTVEVARYGTVACVTDTGGATAGHLVIIGTGTTDTCKDSGQTASSAIATTSRIVGVFRSTATVGNTALVELTPSHFGTQSAGGSSVVTDEQWVPAAFQYPTGILNLGGVGTTGHTGPGGAIVNGPLSSFPSMTFDNGATQPQYYYFTMALKSSTWPGAGGLTLNIDLEITGGTGTGNPYMTVAVWCPAPGDNLTQATPPFNTASTDHSATIASNFVRSKIHFANVNVTGCSATNNLMLIQVGRDHTNAFDTYTYANVWSPGFNVQKVYQ